MGGGGRVGMVGIADAMVSDNVSEVAAAATKTVASTRAMTSLASASASSVGCA